jgi:hypothetical protein
VEKRQLQKVRPVYITFAGKLRDRRGAAKGALFGAPFWFIETAGPA